MFWSERFLEEEIAGSKLLGNALIIEGVPLFAAKPRVRWDTVSFAPHNKQALCPLLGA